MNKRTAVRIAKLVHEIEALMKDESIHVSIDPNNTSYVHTTNIGPLLTNDTVKVRFVPNSTGYPWPWEVDVWHEGVRFMSLESAEGVLALGLEFPELELPQDEPAPQS